MSKKSYNDVVRRWILGSGRYEYQSNNDVFYVMESSSSEGAYYLTRAVINPIKGTRYQTSVNKNLYKVTLCMGNGYKDALHTCTWEDARVIINTHLQDIDRYLERPISNYWIPYENGRVIPRIGDVVVFTKPETSYIGELGVIKEFINRTGSYHIENGFFYPNQKGDFYANEFEVIDHDPSLLNEPAAEKALSNRFEPLDLPGGKNSWLLAIDVSASMLEDSAKEFIANHIDEFKYKVGHTITFDTDIVRKYAGMPSTVSLDSPPSRGGTDIDCVLGYALVNGYHNILIFSDGYFCNEYALKRDHPLNVFIVKTPGGKAEVLIEGKPLVFEEDGWEYWLEKSADKGLYLNKRCKGCGSLHSKVVKNIS